MSKKSNLTQMVYSILCDIAVFKIGYVGSLESITDIVFPIVKNSGQFKQKTDEQIKHSIRDVLQHRNNCYRNKRRGKIIRDIATVKTDLEGKEGHNLYLFGCFVYDYTTPLRKD